MLNLLAVAAFAQADIWLLPNFADRLDLHVANTSDHAIETLAILPVANAARTAPGFPGTLAIVLDASARQSILPSQADDLDGDGTADEFVFPVKLAAHEDRQFHIYYSRTLRDSIPWPKTVHASHAFGYNRATVALESNVIGYRTYGGFFLDIQARPQGQPGLSNSLVGYLGSSRPSPAGADIIHEGDTLGLGGIFLQSGSQLFRPPLNMPDYAHKPAPVEAPMYRVLADGPLRAVVEARMERWTLGDDVVSIVARYSIAGGSTHVECAYRIAPVQLSREYRVGAGIRYLPKMESRNTSGKLSLSGEQNSTTGRMGLALYYDPTAADSVEPIATKDDRNAAVVFRARLMPGHAVAGTYWLAAAWSGSGIQDLLGHLAAIEGEARARVQVGSFHHTHTPHPDRLEGESN